jgi:dihydroorotate dehydrogenase (fumarate)
MANLSTTYLGLKLKNPIIVGSSGLTKSVDNIKKLETNGAGAVVLKSLFEEQIRYEVNSLINQNETPAIYPEAEDYIKNYTQEHKIAEYLDLIKNAKKSVSIPVIASVNCMSASEWTVFAKRIQEAGADALELNIFVMSSSPYKNAEQNEQMYFDIITEVKKHITIPIAIKISYHFSAMAHTIQKLSWTGIQGIVLFNRFFSPDIDIDTYQVTASNIYSTPSDISIPLRWIALLSSRVEVDMAASTGVHDGHAVIKMLLAGAKTVQVCSTLYKNGIEHLATMLKDVESWMTAHQYKTIDDFRGKMSLNKVDNPGAYERVQFMKHLAGIE